MSSQEIEAATAEIRDHIEGFLDTLEVRMEEPRVDEVIEESESLDSENLSQRRERCVEDDLIWPILDTLGFDYTPRPYYPSGDENECPDFRVENLADRVIGENKSINQFGEAKNDLRTYLDSQRYEYGIATDGFRWAVYEVEADERGRATTVDVVAEQNIKPVVRRLARERGLVSYTEELQSESTVEGVLGRFYQAFNHYGVRRAIGGLDEFYDLYVEVLAGDGEYQTIESDIMSMLEAPDDATQSEELAFGALFLDRMAFLKLLDDRGVIEGVSLRKEWEEHNRGLNRFRGSFYSTFLQPLFYDALSAHPKQRDGELQRSLQEVPFLSGGLFERLLPNELAYDLPDETVKTVLSRFVEGEGRTLINEAANGSLLETYTEEYENRELAGEFPQHYTAIVGAYHGEIEFVESQIERTLRSFEG